MHVDAYRLADSTELDDLDLDFNSSVVVAEWGDGLIDAGDSWLHLVIARPEGDIVDADDVTDAEQHWDEEPIEPRLVTITRHGARWTDLEILLPGSTHDVYGKDRKCSAQ